MRTIEFFQITLNKNICEGSSFFAGKLRIEKKNIYIYIHVFIRINPALFTLLTFQRVHLGSHKLNFAYVVFYILNPFLWLVIWYSASILRIH